MVLFIIPDLSAQGNNPIRPIKENGKWGFYDFNTSQVIIEPQYDRIGERNTWGQKIIHDDKIGLIQFSNSFVIAPQYKDIEFLSIDYLIVSSFENKKSIIKRNDGKQIIPFDSYEEINFINNQYFKVKKEGKWAIMNSSGSILTPFNYFDIRTSEVQNLIPVASEKNKYGLLNIQTGELIIPMEYFNIVPQSDQYSIVQDFKNKGIHHHKNQKLIHPLQEKKIKFVTQDFAVLVNHDNKGRLLSLLDLSLVSLKKNYAEFIPFNEEYFLVKSNKKLGLLNLQGIEILDTKYQFIKKVKDSPTYVEVKEEEYIGIIDFTTKKEIIPVIYNNLRRNDEGLILVNRSGSLGMYNKYYKQILLPKYSEVNFTTKDLIKVRQGKGVTIFRLNEKQEIKSEEKFEEFYTLKIGYSNNAIIQNNIPRNTIEKYKDINFLPKLYEWVDSVNYDKKAYRKIGTQKILSNFSFHPTEIKGTHFSLTHTNSKVTVPNIFKFINDYVTRYKPNYIFNENKGIFIAQAKGFIGYRLTDFITYGLPHMAAILEDGQFTLLDIQGNIKQNKGKDFIASYIGEPSEGFIPFAIGGKWVSKSDHIPNITRRLNFIRSFNIKELVDYTSANNRFMFLTGAKWGFLDYEGNIVIPAKYQHAMPMKNGKSIVMLDSKKGVIDSKNKTIIPFEYNEITQSRNQYFHLTKFNDLNINYLIDKNGNLTSDSGNVSKYKATKKDDYFGLLSNEGKALIPFVYDSIGSFKNEYAYAIKNNKPLIIDATGAEYLKNVSYQIKGNVQEGLIRIQENGKYGFVDINSNIKIPAKFSLAFDFDRGVSRFVAARKTGLIDKNGVVILAPKHYELVLPFNESGFAIVQHKQFGPKGLINLEGQEILAPVYDEIDPFYNGYARVRKNKRYGFISLSGEEIIAPTLYNAFKVGEGKVAVQALQAQPWFFMDIKSKENINKELAFFGPAIFKDGKTILRHKNEKDKYTKSLFNDQGDTLASSEPNHEIIFYKEGLLGIKKSVDVGGDKKSYFYHFKALNEDSYRSPQQGYTHLSPFSDGVAIAREGILCSLIDTDATPITSRKFVGIKRNKEGNFIATPFAFHGLASPDGEIILEPIYDKLSKRMLSGLDLYTVELEDQIGYIDGRGNWIWNIQN